MRPIDASPFAGAPKPRELGPAAQLRWLPIAALLVDDEYQRPITSYGAKNVRSIISKFDWRMFAPVVVSPVSGGKYAIVDGQHRTTAAAACGEDQVPCAVIMADRQTQASAFGAINGLVTQVSRQQQFKAALAAGESWAVRIKSVADQSGVVILYFNTATANMKARETVALEAIKNAVQRYGDATTVAALKAICASAEEKPGFLKAAIIKAVVEVLADHVEWVSHPGFFAAFAALDLEEGRRVAFAEAAQTSGLTGQDVLQATIVAHLSETLLAEAA